MTEAPNASRHPASHPHARIQTPSLTHPHARIPLSLCQHHIGTGQPVSLRSHMPNHMREKKKCFNFVKFISQPTGGYQQVCCHYPLKPLRGTIEHVGLKIRKGLVGLVGCCCVMKNAGAVTTLQVQTFYQQSQNVLEVTLKDGVPVMLSILPWVKKPNPHASDMGCPSNFVSSTAWFWVFGIKFWW